MCIQFCIAGGGNPFQNIEKTTVLQEARTFNDTPVNPRKCTHILTKILYLLNQVCNRRPMQNMVFAEPFVSVVWQFSCSLNIVVYVLICRLKTDLSVFRWTYRTYRIQFVLFSDKNFWCLLPLFNKVTYRGVDYKQNFVHHFLFLPKFLKITQHLCKILNISLIFFICLLTK